jgi:hypothetical protein
MTSYRQYLLIDEEKREKQFQAFCKKNKRDPIKDDTVGDDFIDSIVDGIDTEELDAPAKKIKNKRS